MNYDITVSTDLGFDEAVARTREALAEQGFGVLRVAAGALVLSPRPDHFLASIE